SQNWYSYVMKELAKRNSELVSEDVEYSDVLIEDRVRILRTLCDSQFVNPDRFKGAVRGSEEEETHWRVSPLGSDAAGNLYWLFDDDRLYKEVPNELESPDLDPLPVLPPKTKKRGRRSKLDEYTYSEFKEVERIDPGPGKSWNLVCRTIKEWQEFPLQFEYSTNDIEIEFYDHLVEDVIPKIIAHLKEKEDEKRKKEEMLLKQKLSVQTQIRKLEKLNGNISEAYLWTERRVTRSGMKVTPEQPKPPIDERERRFKEREERQSKDRITQLSSTQEATPTSILMEDEASEVANSLKEADGEDDMALLNDDDGSYGEEEEDSPKRKITRKRSEVLVKKKGTRKKKEEEPDEWYFDCTCGEAGFGFDDGTTHIECGSCGVWKHLDCVKMLDKQQNPESLRTWDEDEDYICERCSAPKQPKSSSSGRKKKQIVSPVDSQQQPHQQLQQQPLQQALQQQLQPTQQTQHQGHYTEPSKFANIQAHKLANTHFQQAPPPQQHQQQQSMHQYQHQYQYPASSHMNQLNHHHNHNAPQPNFHYQSPVSNHMQQQQQQQQHPLQHQSLHHIQQHVQPQPQSLPKPQVPQFHFQHQYPAQNLSSSYAAQQQQGTAAAAVAYPYSSPVSM
ncbi:hypothetical protein HK096_005272, partial [Nowakowskiella sp. JEL0078]